MSKYVVTVGSREYHVDINANGEVTVEGCESPISVIKLDEARYAVVIGCVQTVVATGRVEGLYQLAINGLSLVAGVETERDLLLRRYSNSSLTARLRSEVHAPMPALVVRIGVRVGDEVLEGKGLVVLEAMKMENELKAHQAGRVKEILVREGQPVEKGQLLLLLE